jgi:hypothetical protein
MADDNKKDVDSEDVVLNAEEFQEVLDKIADSATAYYTPVSIRAMIDAGEVGVALLLTATRCEQVLVELVKRRFNLTDEQFSNLGWDRKSLGSLKNMCSQTDVTVVCENEQKLNEFTGKRNDLAHSRGYFEEL